MWHTNNNIYVVKQGDVDAVVKILKELKGKSKKSEQCIKSSKKYDKRLKFQEYIELYQKILEKEKNNTNE